MCGSLTGAECPQGGVRFPAVLSLRTQSFCRYRIQGEIPTPWSEAFHERLTARRFLPLLAGQERAYGWVTADNLLVTDFHVGTVMRGEWAAFSMRLDTKRVNARLLRAQIDLEVKARLSALQDAGEKARLGRDERRELREDLRKELMRQTNPGVDAWTVLLHPKQRVLHVLTLGRTPNELVRLHFADTFDADLLPLTPWSRGLEILDARAQGGVDLRGALQDLRRTDFGRSAVESTPASSRRAGASVLESEEVQS